MEDILAEKRRNLLRYTPKPHSHALNDVIMHKTHCNFAPDWLNKNSVFVLIGCETLQECFCFLTSYEA